MGDKVEFNRVAPGMAPRLAAFFKELVLAGDENFFHPHAFTDSVAHKICNYTGKDLYFVGTLRNRIVAYGMLRGWDEGFEIPSLGIAVLPTERGRGVGKAFMRFLHDAAAERAAGSVRLKVHRKNHSARRLYESLGYLFSAEEGDQLVGFLELQQTSGEKL